MEASQEKAMFYPIGRSVELAGAKYQTFDPQLSSVRANIFFQEAIDLLANEKTGDYHKRELINTKLLNSIDFGSAQAPYLFALRILQAKAGDQYTFADAIVLLSLASERGNAEASHYLGSCYAGKEESSHLMNQAKSFFDEIDPEDRAVLAEYYLGLSTH